MFATIRSGPPAVNLDKMIGTEYEPRDNPPIYTVPESHFAKIHESMLLMPLEEHLPLCLGHVLEGDLPELD